MPHPQGALSHWRSQPRAKEDTNLCQLRWLLTPCTQLAPTRNSSETYTQFTQGPRPPALLAGAGPHRANWKGKVMLPITPEPGLEGVGCPLSCSTVGRGHSLNGTTGPAALVEHQH